MENNTLRKKAEMTSATLITIIVLIVSFVIILIVLLFADLGGETDRTVCHQSVVVRGTLPDSLGVNELPPLKCSTRKVCITNKIIGKGECEEELGKEYDTVRVAKGSKMDNEINAFVADEMAGCWSMMGEGKVQVFTRKFGFSDFTSRCSVCSRIAFDSSIKEEKKEITGLVEYMLSHKIPNQEVYYWDYIMSGLDVGEYNPLNDKYSTEQKAIIFMELDKTNAPSWMISVVGAVGGCTLGAKAGVVIGGIIGSPTGPGAIVTGAAGGIIGCAVGAVSFGLLGNIAGEEYEEAVITEKMGDAEFIAANFFLDYNENIKGLECDSMENIP